MEPILDIRNLKVKFKSDDKIVRAVDGVNLQINRGETVGLVGESGCGKSVTSLAIMGLLPNNGDISDGSVYFKGRDLVKAPEKKMQKIRGNEISMIFQDPMTSLNPVLTIAEQLEEVIRIHEGGSKKAIRNKAIDLLNIVKIPDANRRILEYPHQMSGGIRQRIMIAIALACNPTLLIADEPTTALDVTVQAQILSLIKELQDELGTAVLLISHDLGVIAQVVDKVSVMYAGQIVESAKTHNFFASPKHPYSIGLLETIPKIDECQDELVEIKGMVPDLSEEFTGCRFYSRCPKAIDGCNTINPSLIQDNESLVRCLLYSDKVMNQ
ncbi:Oligopeptide ABC transporter, ATP-binding protein OppD [Candidatus Syntrophocurvum alkaliphilum]|uniref:Oligopeptide ABC transporter, ATP-binding protein OppD n=1 Tax=Candidatus Syntrophocurvum alkaliphilum TaxID=2293317 RepID=A0A6I6DE31_9FIRM|nr:ABC transporter ATP-binding protein [Candidatus Syntrophocurvum alkaliphilum]QGU00366.1 Oligopeptide ABC transporter, ATP-binding protein OppD [Candidatus Syntrophocurvum alkaliphilum]